MHLTPALPTVVAAALAAGTITACMAEQATPDDLAQVELENAVAVSAQAISGSVTLSGNCAGMDARIRDLVGLAGWYSNYAGGDLLTSCLARSIFSYNDDSFPERIQKEVGANQVTQVECVPNILDTDGNILPGAGQAFPRADGTEAIRLATNRLPSLDDPIAIGLIMHEVSHNRGYDHPENVDSFDYNATVPQHLLGCGVSFRNNVSPAVPLGKTRYDFQNETKLAPVGGGGGAPGSRRCYFGNRAAGLSVRTSGQLDALGIRCRNDPNAIPSLNFSRMGGTGGSPSELDCAAGEVLVGVYGNADNTLLARIGPICASIADVQNGATGPNPVDTQLSTLRYRNAAGMQIGYDFERICPRNMVVDGFGGRAGAAVDRLELSCRHLDNTENLVENLMTKHGGNGGKAFSDRCVGRSALVGLTYETDWVLARLGGVCTEVSHGCIGTTCFEFQTSGTRHALGSHGGGSRVVANEKTDECAQNEALVGLNIRAGSLVDAVGGICASIGPWSLPPNLVAAPTNDLPIRGGNGGQASRVMCPRGQFLTGWNLRSGALVDSVQPVCRDFN